MTTDKNAIFIALQLENCYLVEWDWLLVVAGIKIWWRETHFLGGMRIFGCWGDSSHAPVRKILY